MNGSEKKEKGERERKETRILLSTIAHYQRLEEDEEKRFACLRRTHFTLNASIIIELVIDFICSTIERAQIAGVNRNSIWVELDDWSSFVIGMCELKKIIDTDRTTGMYLFLVTVSIYHVSPWSIVVELRRLHVNLECLSSLAQASREVPRRIISVILHLAAKKEIACDEHSPRNDAVCCVCV